MTEFGSMLQIYEEQSVMINVGKWNDQSFIHYRSVGFVHRQVKVILFIILGEGEMVGAVESCMLY